LNEARLSVDRTDFVLTHAPIPSPGRRASTSSIDRFEATELPGKRADRWRVRMLPREGAPALLTLALESGQHARFIASRLNDALAAANGSAAQGDSADAPPPAPSA
jgi:hypothetical protein